MKSSVVKIRKAVVDAMIKAIVQQALQFQKINESRTDVTYVSTQSSTIFVESIEPFTKELVAQLSYRYFYVTEDRQFADSETRPMIQLQWSHNDTVVWTLCVVG